MRDRLIELIDYMREYPEKLCPQFNSKMRCNGCKYEELDDCASSRIADYLLSNGVIVLPFNIGDTLYDISEFTEKRRYPEMYELNNSHISIQKDRNGEYFFVYDYIEIFPNDIGKTVFLTREEAEAKLKGGVQE